MEDDNRSEQEARAQLDSILEMLNDLGQAERYDNEEMRECALQRIQEDPLTVEVRSDWHFPGEPKPLMEYKILLCTGGPAVQIVGDLNEYGEPENAKLQHQDWFVEWKGVNLTEEEAEKLLAYAGQFYYIE